MYDKVEFDFSKLLETYKLNVDFLETLEHFIYTFKVLLYESKQNRQKVFIFGVGDSNIAAKFLHLHIENSIILDASVSKIAKVGMSEIFSSSLDMLAQKEDLAIGFGINSGEKSLIGAFKRANELKCKTISIVASSQNRPFGNDLEINLNTTSQKYILPMQLLICSMIIE